MKNCVIAIADRDCALASLAARSLDVVGVSAVARGAASAQPAAQRDVAKVYAEVCAACHGAKLEGGKAQSLLDDTWVFGGDDASMATTIREGRLAAGMPAFASLLTEPEIRAMVYYLRETRATLRAGQRPGDHHARPVRAHERAPRLSHRDRRRRADDAVGHDVSARWPPAGQRTPWHGSRARRWDSR